MASWLVRSTPERTVRVRALVGDIVLSSWARHFTLTVPLSTQVYKWVPANLMLYVVRDAVYSGLKVAQCTLVKCTAFW